MKNKYEKAVIISEEFWNKITGALESAEFCDHPKIDEVLEELEEDPFEESENTENFNNLGNLDKQIPREEPENIE